MMGGVLIGLDGSTYSQRAIELGIRWAQQAQALLAGIGILDEPGIQAGEIVPLGGAAFKEHRDELRLAEAEDRLKDFYEQFEAACQQANVPRQIIHARGRPAEEILKVAPEFDMILLGRKTYFHFETSAEPDETTLEHVLRQGVRPVVAVPETLPAGSAIVVAYDGSLQATRAVQTFLAVGLPRIHKVHVVSVDHEADIASKHARLAVHFFRHHRIEAEARPIASRASVADVLLEQVEQLQAGLLVMGAFGQSNMAEFFFGSVTQKIISETQVPLFLYH
jgi:nucleotide-binding universal stress UspA family protein